MQNCCNDSGSKGSLACALGLFAALLLVIYSIALMVIDATQSRDFVRIFFTDIGMPYKEAAYAAADGHIGYGLNTTLSAFFFASAGVMMFFSALGRRSTFDRGDLLFLLQGMLLIYLAADDRFLLHERFSQQFYLYSSIIILSVMVLNLFIYIILFRFKYFNNQMVKMLLITGSVSALAAGVDFFIPLNFPVRLSLEDLLKLWSAFFFLLFAWETARFRLIGRYCGEQSFMPPGHLLQHIPSWLRARLTS